MSGYPAYVRLKDGSKVLVQSEEEEKAVKAGKPATAEKAEKPEPAAETEPEDDPPSKFLGTKKK